MIDTDFNVCFSIDSLCYINKWSKKAEKIFGWSEEEALGKRFFELIVPEEERADIKVSVENFIETRGGAHRMLIMEFHTLHKNHHKFPIEVSLNPAAKKDSVSIDVFITNITEQRYLQKQLNQYHRLETLGQLTSGIAHEIKTPLQFIGDNTRFVQDAMEKLIHLIKEYQLLIGNTHNENINSPLKLFKERCKEINVNYLIKEIPDALEQSLEGISQVKELVGAIEVYSHPETKDKKLNDINKAIVTTINVSRNEWKYVADTKIDLDADLPLVPCHINEISQVILNLITNGAHSIKDKIGNKEYNKGKITIISRLNEKFAEIKVVDDGMGIPEEVQPKLFDPFFTTKEFGMGTGQGLAIALKIIEGKHQGKINFDTELGKGTSFKIKLPIT